MDLSSNFPVYKGLNYVRGRRKGWFVIFLTKTNGITRIMKIIQFQVCSPSMVNYRLS